MPGKLCCIENTTSLLLINLFVNNKNYNYCLNEKKKFRNVIKKTVFGKDYIKCSKS